MIEAAQNPDPALGGLDVPIAVADLFQTVQYTNFPERAEAIANEIFFLRPHLIGLQEVSKWYIQSPSDFFDPFPPYVNPDQQPADVVVYDFLQILLDALAARGLNYQVAVATTGNADVELPMLTGWTAIEEYPYYIPTFDDVRLEDRDVILVRGDVDTSNPATASYLTNVSESVGGVELEFTRGWVAVDADVGGEVYRFVNTHLEVRSSPYSIFRVVQSAQMNELLTILAYEPQQIILAGDFNSSQEDVPGLGYYPDDLDEDGLPIPGAVGIEYVPPYMLAKDYFGYLDAWDLLFWPRNGFTDGFNETVDDPNARLTSRIDLIFLSQAKNVKYVFGIRTGAHKFCMTPSGLWPSDHAGVFTYIVFDD
ncbi:MAG: endonuclease/exonuclease/phosphatase family protein [Deltaproteobacteria bacterium]|nr:endonuclease/exonuclease/phosphatase family protein [Deltaproteobacteria bacterium]